MVKFTLNGQEIEVDDNTTILKAARDFAIDVPTFCYQDRLSTLASCRMCLVEVVGHRKLEPACATVVGDGMVVNTHSENVVRTREDMLEILLANHPLDCPICDKGGECELQDTVFEYGKGDSRLHDDKRVFRSRDIELNKVIIFNANRCIQCQRCVRVCEEVVGEVALGTAERGLASEITGVGDSLSGCSHCGNCIEICPVGALMSTPYRYSARPWDLERVDTICNMCGTGCSMTIETRDGALMRVKSKYESGLNGELLCAKGRFGFDAIEGGERIEQPMIRKGGILTPVSWDEATHFIADTARDIIDSGGKIAGYISPRQTNEAAYLFFKLMRNLFRTDAIHSSARFHGIAGGDKSAMKALAQLMGQRYSRMPLQTLVAADCIVLLGANISEENPVSGYLLRQSLRDSCSKLFIASSRPCGLDDIASAHLRLAPGGEASLLSVLLTPEGAEDDTLAAFITRVMGALAGADSVSLLLGTEFLRTDAAGACLNWIEKVARRMEAEGKKIFVQFLFDRPNQLGVWDMERLPDMLAGWQFIDSKADPEEGPLDMFYALGAELLAHSAEAAGCVIVQASHMNRAVEKATVVLPSPSYGEETGTYTNNEGRVQAVRAVKPLPDGVLSSGDAFGLIAAAMGSILGPVRPEQIYAEIRQEVPAYADLADWSDEIDFGMTLPLARGADDVALEDIAVKEVKPPKGYHLITGDDLFQSGQMGSRSAILSSLASEAYVEMNPGDRVDDEGGDYVVTLQKDGARFTAPLKINRAFPNDLVFVPEKWLCDPERDFLSGSQYPCPVEVTIKEK